jgi:phage terminase Nu1 subunit (DNA packaging protein)
MLDIRLKRKKLEAMEKPPQSKRDKSVDDVADILSLATRTVQKWVQRGCPHDLEGTAAKLDAFEVNAWAKAQGLSMRPGRPADKNDKLMSIRIKREQEMLEKYQRENKQARGLLIDAAEEEKRDVARIVAIRNKLSGLEASLPARLIGLDAVEIQTILHANFERFLNEFANDRSTLD